MRNIFTKRLVGILGVGLTAILLSAGPAQALIITVNDAGDTSADDGACTLREAVEAFNAQADATDDCDLGGAFDATDDTIVFDPGIGGTITLTGGTIILAGNTSPGDPPLTPSISIEGPGSNLLTIDGSGGGRIFRVDDTCGICGSVAFTAIFKGVTITNGGGVDVIDGDGNSALELDEVAVTGNTMAPDTGGGVHVTNGCLLTVTDSLISNNSTTENGGGIGVTQFGTAIIKNSTISDNDSDSDTDGDGDGGGIFNADGGSLTIENSAIVNNGTSVDNCCPSGGGIQNEGDSTSLSITNSTISGNFTDENGGGINNEASGFGTNTVTLLNVTIFGNTADLDTGSGDGGGISQGLGAGAFTITNSIIAGNFDPTSAPDCNTDGTDVTSGGNNLIGSDEGCADETFDAPLNDQVGSLGSEINPLLGTLTPAGGGDPSIGELTGTHAPLAGSTAIDGVDPGIATLIPSTDQRGFIRPVDGNGDGDVRADIGAVEISCGNNIPEASEECDEGGETATCDANCTAVSCGDGDLNTTAGEACDSAGESATCNADCTASSCGDGVLNATAGETCDDAGESVTCDDDCTATACGDGKLNVTAAEECEDGNTDDGDGCSSACLNEFDPSCGDGILQVGEECDDGNLDNGDGCSATCTEEGDTDEDGTPDVADDDDDGDGVADADDNCPLDANSDQADTDEDTAGDACDPDDDGDGVADGNDNCPTVANTEQEDGDEDGFGDACDIETGCNLTVAAGHTNSAGVLMFLVASLGLMVTRRMKNWRKG